MLGQLLKSVFFKLMISLVGDGYLMIMVLGVDKGWVVDYFVSIGIFWVKVVVVGDDENDLFLLNWVGYVVVVGNVVLVVK